ncbi:hypothetical protein WMY93_018369 [Mugilogobius chulae]|uniref:Homeobox domain-containing protein n=1 Tax=Mugilogobius chulae TaxID=88201 RepID=A0AAW0NNN9_9GOBI
MDCKRGDPRTLRAQSRQRFNPKLSPAQGIHKQSSMWKDTCDDDARLGSNMASSRNASRRKRTSFSKEHVELLKATFETDPYPGISLRESLSHTTGLPESRIQVVVPEPTSSHSEMQRCEKSSWQSDSPGREATLLTPHIAKRASVSPQAPPPPSSKKNAPKPASSTNALTPTAHQPTVR